MEKKVYLLTCTCFSKFDGGVEYQITMSFDCDAEIQVFQSKEDAFERMSERISIALSNGWVVINSNEEFAEMLHATYTWRKVYEITEKTIY